MTGQSTPVPRGADPAPLRLEPVLHLERAGDGEDGRSLWTAIGVDPQFMVRQAGGEGRFPPGWYVFEGDLRCIEGHLDNPCLYPDMGRGYGDVHRVPVAKPDARGRLRCVVRFEFDVRSLRFDPSASPCTFETGGLRLRRMGKWRAAAMMLGRLAGRVRDDRGLLGVAWSRGLSAIAKGGLRGFGEWLYRFHEVHDLGPSLDYQAWISQFDVIDDADRRQMRLRGAKFRDDIDFSVLVPVYNTPERWLRRCVDSVLAQAWPRWQLVLADDASTEPHVARILAEYAARDPRIIVISRERNGHISEASNSALAAATGRYVALLDHDDEIPPQALYLVAKALQETPALKLVYSDEDKIDEYGVRFDPYFKPDWNPELLLAQNYVCHLGVYDAAMVRQVGGFRAGYEGSQDHDLVLRCVATLAPHEIGHVPHVLYHWRAIAGSTALSGGEKSYAASAGVRALRDHMGATGRGGDTVEEVSGGYRVCRALPSPLPKVSLVVPTRDRVDLLRTCIESITSVTDYDALEILVVDNGSTDAETLRYLESLRRRPGIRVLPYDAPFNYSRINNVAAREATGDVIGLVNNDIEAIHADWLREMVGHAVDPANGAVGAMLYYPDDRIQHAGTIIGLGGVAGHAWLSMARGYPGQHHRAHLTQNLSAVTAACLLVRREVFEEVGGLDESFEVAFNDVDFCLRVAARGYRNVWTPWAELYHHESASRGHEDNPAKRARFEGEVGRMLARWGTALLRDPAYSPNLGLGSHLFPLAVPPRLPMRESLRDSRAVNADVRWRPPPSAPAAVPADAVAAIPSVPRRPEKSR